MDLVWQTHREGTRVNAFCPWPCVLISGRTQAPWKQTPSKGRRRFLNRANLFQYRNTHMRGVLLMLTCSSKDIHVSKARILLLWVICRTARLAKCCAKCLPPVTYSSLPSNLRVYWKALLQRPYCRPHSLNKFNYFSYCHATRKAMRIHNYIRAYSHIRKRHILLYNNNYIMLNTKITQKSLKPVI